MMPNKEIDLLAEEVLQRCRGGRSRQSQSASARVEQAVYSNDPQQQPFVLFLGPACAVAAGVPGKEQVVRLILDLAAKDEELTAIYPLIKSGVNLAASLAGDELLKLFYNLMDELKKKAGGKIYRMLLKFYSNVPVPLFYQDLALLIKADFFERILTTNIDTLLEQAFNIAGLQTGYDYRVTSIGVAESGGDGGASDWDEPAHQKQIIKLFGDLAQEQVNINLQDIDSALKNHRRYVKSELEGDIIMVGYDFESKPINEWLKHGGRRRNQLWWVGEEMPSPTPDASPEEWAEQVHFITGKIGSSQEFFSQLKLRLLRRPTFDLSSYPDIELKRKGRRQDVKSPQSSPSLKSVKTLDQDSGSKEVDAMRGLTDATELPENAANLPGEQPATDAIAAIESVLPEEMSIIEDLRGNIRRSQAVLFSLEQTATPGDVPTSVQAQVAYQKQQIAEMEDKMRSLASSRRSIIQTLDAIMQGVRNARQGSAQGKTGRGLDDNTVRFLEQQCRIVEEEYARDEPNHFVISAAIGATVMLAERLCVELGPDIVKAEYVRRLAAFAPSVAGRGII